jgi:hypothetical protein
MEKFSAATFQQIGVGLTFLLESIDKLPPEAEGGDLAVKFIPMVSDVRRDCEKLDLRISVACADEFILLADMLTLGELTRRIKELESTIRREMQVCLFFHVPFRQAQYYQKSMPFGARVDVRLPATQFDIAEAGNCYAVGRPTACVFHLMRVMEVGVQKMGELLGVQFATEKNWQNILDEVNKAIKALPPKAQKTIALSEIAAHLYNVKVAWRNQVMHPHDKYSMDEAKDLLGHVESFIKALSNLMPVPKGGPILIE